MPSMYAHFVFGKNVYQKFPSDIKKIIKEHRELFFIGLHGPDIFFYYKPLGKNPVKRLGSHMHDMPGRDFFEPAARAIGRFLDDKGDFLPGRKHVGEDMLAYALGFLCHFSLDTTCHGYIENKIRLSGVSHTEIEAELERSLLERDGFNPVHHRLTGHIVPSLYNGMVMEPFFPELEAGQIKESLESLVRYNDLLMAPHVWKRWLIYGVMAISGNYKELHGLVIRKKPNPKCKDSCLRLEKLMDKAIGLCMELTENYLEFLKHKAEMDKRFNQTFGPGPDWKSIPVYSWEEELKYEV